MNFFKNNKYILLIILVLLLGIFFILDKKFRVKDNSDSIVLSEKSSDDNEVSQNEVPIKKIYVDVKGAVKKPGVYSVNSDSIINDVINLAGGFTKNAYTNNVNLSKKVSNEMVIYIYTKNEYSKKVNKTDVNDVSECKVKKENIIIEDCVETGKSIITPESSEKDVILTTDENINKEENSIVNINNASVDELMTLSGVGESKAKSIIEYREKNGLFNNVEEIKNVSGFGEAIFEKIKDYITI